MDSIRWDYWIVFKHTLSNIGQVCIFLTFEMRKVSTHMMIRHVCATPAFYYIHIFFKIIVVCKTRVWYDIRFLYYHVVQLVDDVLL
jgi:hypothetical protein